MNPASPVPSRAQLGSGNRVLAGFLADPTHVSIGFLSLAVAVGLIPTAHHVDPLPPALVYAWVACLTLSGLGKIAVPYIYLSTRWMHLGREFMLASSMLAAATWGTIAIGLALLGPDAAAAVIQAAALSLGATGRYLAAIRLGRVERELVELGGKEDA